MSDKLKIFLAFVEGNYPNIRHLWTTEGRVTVYDEDAVVLYFATASPGERVILKCLLSIWSGQAGEDNRIDITDLAAISTDAKKPLLEWMLNPFWP